MGQKKSGFGLGRLAQIGGMIAGGAVGGLPGAAAGASIGGMAGGMLEKPEKEGPAPLQTGPLNRRMQQLDQSPLRQIRESIDSLKYVPDPQQRMELAKPLLQADYLARNKA